MVLDALLTGLTDPQTRLLAAAGINTIVAGACAGVPDAEHNPVVASVSVTTPALVACGEAVLLGINYPAISSPYADLLAFMIAGWAIQYAVWEGVRHVKGWRTARTGSAYRHADDTEIS